MSQPSATLDALVIGAGPAGIGTALALSEIEGLQFGVLERGQIGQTFHDWPAEQRFLTPSFTGNGFGATDLNSIHPDTSPAYSIGVDYLDGTQYARYLRGVVRHFELPVLANTEVTSITRSGDGFEVESSQGPVHARTVVWAGGEFAQPKAPKIAGAGFLDHSSGDVAWERREGTVVILGGYESGLDLAAFHLSTGASVVVVDRNAPWDVSNVSDPSFRLAPRSRIRLDEGKATGRLELIEAHAVSVKRSDDGFTVMLDNGTRINTTSRPIAAVGFGAGLGPVEHLFERRADGWPLLDDNDQSTLTPGLFLSGPSIRHGREKFCFVYKFRQRFAHVASIIGMHAGKGVGALEAYRAAGMLTDDLSCCGTNCAC